MRRAAGGFEADHAALSEIWQYRYFLHHTIFDGKRPISGSLPSEYDAAGYTYRLGMFEDGRRHLVMRAAIALECPVRLLHGMQDTAVPWETSLSLAERLQSSDVAVTLVKDGDHRLSREADLARLARILDGLISTECSQCG